VSLDGHSFAVAAAFICAVQALASFYVWHVQLRDRAVIQLALSAAIIAMGAALGASRPHLPLVLTHLTASACLVIGHALGASAFARFLGRRVPLTVLVGLSVAAVAFMTFFLFVAPRTEIRIAIYSLSVAAYSLIIAGLLLDVPRGPLRTTHWPVGILYLVHAVFALVQAFSVLIQARDDIFAPGWIQALWFIQSIAVVTLTFTGLVLMATQRISIELDRQTSYDALTGALNRRAFERLAEAEWSRSIRHDLPLSVLVLDLDRFKTLNDAHGRDTGDVWLKAFVDMTVGLLRREDILCRYGGEEFVILLPQTGLEAATYAAERIRRSVDGLRIEGSSVSGSVSVGVAEKSPGQGDFKALFTAADQALHRAKQAGRNRVAT
jgi:diguanylate cyclase (GGDEF)-like protein